MIKVESDLEKKYTYVHTYWFVYPFLVGMVTVSMQGYLVQRACFSGIRILRLEDKSE